ncbi:M23 family metallopeptidase [Pedobacter sp. Hv1]|uniref:M23 family metallopeptidase n=1 Tax=Pedobacter sp. Hv1 TaxID=1740090 RepID=UPI0006D8CF89|nr:M23 family metallopeptidase [Pedobacter sp. Hv1]KQB99857.1 hypothetical protein AQF98_15180 [Pedobacter sp. Hv1]
MIRLFFLVTQFLLFPIYAQGQNNSPICLPLGQLYVNSPFGKRIHPVTGHPDFHRGVDLAARYDPVFSIMDGKVSATGYNPILGNYVRIMHGQFQSVYGHLSYILVLSGDEVIAGQPIGITGATGRVTGEHLHFSIKFRERYLNPLFFLKTLMTSEQETSVLNQ